MSQGELSGARFWLALAAVCALAFAARVATYRSVFPPSGEVELVPSDSHLYVRFARLQLAAFPRIARRDPYLDYPNGAELHVPVLHTWAVALAVLLAGADRAEAGAAWVGPVLGTAEVLAVALLGAWAMGRRRALGMAALLALTAGIVEVGAIGNADHHVHEAAFAAAGALAIGAALARRTPRAAFWAGALVAMGRVMAPSGFVFFPSAAAAFVIAAWVTRKEDPVPRWSRLALGCGAGGAAALAASVALLGHPGSLAYAHFSSFHLLLFAALFAASAGACAIIQRERRGSAWLLAALLIAVPLAPEILRATSHLGRGDPLLSVIFESQPLWSDPRWALALLGPSLLALPLGLAAAVRQLRTGRAPFAAAALAYSIPLALASALQARFAPALGGASAVLLAWSLPELLPGRGGARRLAIAGSALVASTLLLAALPRPYAPPPRDFGLARPTLRWMREHLRPASADPYSTMPAGYGVVAPWLLGNVVPLWAERPTVGTLLSQDPAFVEANARASALLAAGDDEEAYRLALESGVRYVLATPSDRILGKGAPGPSSLLVRLLDHAGMETGTAKATAHFRLVHESAERRLRVEGGSAARLFEVVRGAVLGGHAPPRAEVAARLQVTTDQGRRLEYLVRARADASGAWAARVAYPGRYSVRAGPEQSTACASEAEVIAGARAAACPAELGAPGP